MINGNEVIVRRAEQTDIDGLVARSSALFAEDAGARDPGVDINWPRKHGPQRFSSGLTDPSRLLLVADGDDGEVVGCLAGTLVEPSAMKRVKVATLVSRYVRPAYRRDRIGGRMVDAFRAWAKESGAGSAQVTACATNAEAIRFYERNGFASQSVTLEAAL
ncbi:GNAT family N-acetyltransferase [Streptomyces sp. AK02-04a]|uniref:GNAT family N-acetyltransferase n=1 Tax=Streptomyces sp. AK02-04a TaxID=3028649 RepID=UPI0029A9FFB0|nr:GNAT family N-acetyltransferase [Streptomyces sp. AK02-04a]MDX3757595.1 GNAT family N-acetyltransferase [Streptomyces sp. AK02-04a]